ncbi:hypothetical protein JCM8097_002878, partial [Rhodosporidiobolus ruineniae]
MIPESRRRNWGTALKSYHTYAAMEGIPDEERFPITTFKLSFFIASQLGLVRLDSLKAKIAALKDAITA